MKEGIENRENEQSAEDVIAHKLEGLLRDKTGQTFELTEYDSRMKSMPTHFFLPLPLKVTSLKFGLLKQEERPVSEE